MASRALSISRRAVFSGFACGKTSITPCDLVEKRIAGPPEGGRIAGTVDQVGSCDRSEVLRDRPIERGKPDERNALVWFGKGFIKTAQRELSLG